MQPNLPTYEQNSCQQVNILPSYQMHQSIMERGINLRTEIYEPLPPYVSNGNYSDAESFSSMSTSSTANGSTSISITDDDSFGPKFLDFHRKLSPQVNNNIEMSINFTTDNILGKEPSFVDVKKYEYNQSDTISGYVILKNITNESIPFSFFYVIFEGNIMQNSPFTRAPNLSENFLQIVDLAASSHFTNIHNIPSFDPIDSSKLQFEDNGSLLPHVSYKRYFSFKIPEKLLDRGDSRVSLHQEIPPSTTVSNVNICEKYIQYSVNSKLIGLNTTLSTYKLIREVESIIRIIPLKPISVEQEEKFHDAEVEYNFNTLINVMKNYLKNSASKRKLMDTKNNEIFDFGLGITPEHTKFMLHQTTKPLLGASKSLGCVVATIPKLHFKVQYIAPQLFRSYNVNASALETWKINIPLQLDYSQIRKCSLPKIKSISAKLVQMQISSTTIIPIEINHEMLFNNFTGHSFETLVQKRFTVLIEQIKNKASKSDNDWAATDPIIKEAEKLTNLKTKRLLLSVPLQDSRPEINWVKNQLGDFTSIIDLSIDLSKAISSESSSYRKENYAFDEFNLTPCFQNSSLIRMYYVKVQIVFTQSMELLFNLPLTIEN